MAQYTRRVLLLLLVCPFSQASASEATDPYARSLKQLTLDQLMDVEVTSVSRTAEAYGNAAAAVTVVTAEHIRRSGATAIPEALRWVPGLHVARHSANEWAVAARGFSSISSEKLLVLSDSRSIYTPLFSGVLWDVQDYFLHDLDRIEVIRGPGASLWGSNAVNGVINIITKSAADTQGTAVEVGAGTEEHAMLGARYGGRVPGGHFRVFAKYFDRGSSSSDSISSDDSRLAQVGFRADWAPNPQDELTLQGDVYRGNIGRLAPSITIIGRDGPTGDLETFVSGGNILGRWRHRIDEASNLQFRVYYDRSHRNDPSYEDDLDTIDLDLQHRFSPAAAHEVISGLNYRYTSNRNEGKMIFALERPDSTDHLFSGFIQDQFNWTRALQLTVGTKLEHNDFSGFEVQPSVRAAWQVSPDSTIWGSISRAARIPTRLERDIAIDINPGADPLYRFAGNDDFEAEELLAYELGFRWRVSSAVHLDVALFENRYDDLASLEFGASFVDAGGTVVPLVFQNVGDGRARGVETLVTFSVSERWRLSATHSYIDMEIDSAGADLNRSEFRADSTPRHQFALSSLVTFPGDIQFDMHFLRVGSLRRLPELPSGEGVSGYSELDVRLAWRATDHLQLVLVGQNLLHDEHLEWATTEARGYIERGAYAKAVWDF